MAFNLGAIYADMALKTPNWSKGVNTVLNDTRRMKGEFRQNTSVLHAQNAAFAQHDASLNSLSGGFKKLAGQLGLAYLGYRTLKAVTLEAATAQIRFESSFAGVRKTVNATEEEFKELQRTIRALSLATPIDVNELNRIAEAGGQLGIARSNILDFTDTIAKLGVTTDLTTDQAAMALAQWANITRLPQNNIENLASAIVYLGNTSATTESKIVDMGMRIAGAGAQIGLSDAEIAAFAATLSSVGIEAEAGGTAFSKIMVDMAQSIHMATPQLDLFASLAGKSTEAFKRLFESNSADAVMAVVTGLRNYQAAGGNLFQVLEKLELADIRVRDALLRAAGAGDLVTRSIDGATRAFKENEALTREANLRYETTESRLQVLKNTFGELQIAIGEAFGPTTRSGIEVAISLLDELRSVAREAANDINKAFGDTLKNISSMQAQFRSDIAIAAAGAMGKGGSGRRYKPEFEGPSSALVGGGGFDLFSVDWAALGTDQEYLNSQVDKLLDQIANGPAPDLKATVDQVLGGMDSEKKGGGKSEAASQLEQLTRQGEALHRTLNPVVDLLKTAQEQTKALDAAGLLNDEQRSLLGESLWKRFGDMSEFEIARARKSLGNFDAAVAKGFDAAMGKAAQEEASKFWESIQPPEITAFRYVEEGLKQLQTLGRVGEDDLSIFSRHLWESVLGQLAPEALDDILNRVGQLGAAGAGVAVGVRGAAEDAAFQASVGRGNDIFAGLGTAQSIIPQLRQDMEDFINAGHLNEETGNVLAGNFWQNLGKDGRDAFSSIVDELKAKFPQFADVFDGMKSEMDDLKKVSDFSNVANTLDGLAGALSKLPEEYQAAALAAQIASRIMRIAAALAGDPWAAVTLIIEGVAEAFSLMGNDAEKELTGIEKLFDELGKKIEDWGQEFTDVLVEFVKTGELTFKEFIDSVLEDILRLTIQTTITDPIVGAIQGMFAKGAAFDRGNIVPFAKGGVVSKPTIFPMADGMGLMGEAGPEAVMPLKRMPGGALGVQAQGGGGVKVEVYDQRSGGAPVEVQEHRGPNGERVVKMIVRDAVNEMMADGTFDRRLANNYGVRRRPI